MSQSLNQLWKWTPDDHRGSFSYVPSRNGLDLHTIRANVYGQVYVTNNNPLHKCRKICCMHYKHQTLTIRDAARMTIQGFPQVMYVSYTMEEIYYCATGTGVAQYISKISMIEQMCIPKQIYKWLSKVKNQLMPTNDKTFSLFSAWSPSHLKIGQYFILLRNDIVFVEFIDAYKSMGINFYFH